MSPAQTSRGRARQGGFTLVEFMVSAVLGLFLVGVMGTVFLGSKATYRAQEAMARLQENGRFALDAIGADLRMAGFRGCLGYGRATPLVSTLNAAGASLYNFAAAVGANRSVGGSWSPALDPMISALRPAPDPAGQILTVRRPVGQGWALTAEMVDGTSALTVGTPAPIVQGDVLMVTDCRGSAVFQATNAAPGSTGSVQHAAGTGVSPGLASGNLGRAFLQDALIYRMQTVSYYLAPSARADKAGLMSLWAFVSPVYDGTVQPAEIVTGVERMSVTLGVDTDADQNADQYLPPNSVADWSTVISARVELLLVGDQDKVTTAPQAYVFGGVSTTPADRRLRTPMLLVASLRNASP